MSSMGDKVLGKALRIVSWVDENIERRIWTAAEIREKFGKRSAAEILKEGHIHYYDPCIDLDSVVVYLMKNEGLHPRYVIFRSHERLLPTAYHCVTELDISGKSYTFIMGKSRKDYILTEKISLKRRNLYRLNLENMEIANTPMLEQVTKGGIENLNKLIPGFNYTFYLLWLYSTCRKGKFRRVKQKNIMRTYEDRFPFIPIRSHSRFADI